MSLKRIYRKYISIVQNHSVKIRLRKQFIAELIEVKRMNQSVPVKGTTLHKEDRERITQYWKSIYGKRIPLLWHKKYFGYSGSLDVNYFPEILYTTKLEPLLNPDKVCEVLSDKSLIEFLYHKVYSESTNIVIPGTICGCSNGYYYDGDRNFITKAKAIALLEKIEGNAIIKPTIGESSGRGVKLLSIKNGTGRNFDQTIDQIINDYGDNFIVQKQIIEHDAYRALHPESLNTIRVMTYRKDEEIKHAPIIMRIGVGSTHLDNAHAGGLYVAVSDEGVIQKRALRSYTNSMETHPDTGIVFDGYRLPHFHQIIEAAYNLHKCLPNIGFANWDLCLDENENVVLIECNLRCGSIWLFQNAWGKGVFGDDTEYFAAKIRR